MYKNKYQETKEHVSIRRVRRGRMHYPSRQRRASKTTLSRVSRYRSRQHCRISHGRQARIRWTLRVFRVALQSIERLTLERSRQRFGFRGRCRRDERLRFKNHARSRDIHQGKQNVGVYTVGLWTVSVYFHESRMGFARESEHRASPRMLYARNMSIASWHGKDRIKGSRDVISKKRHSALRPLVVQRSFGW